MMSVVSRLRSRGGLPIAIGTRLAKMLRAYLLVGLIFPHQKTTIRAVTSQWCESNERCSNKQDQGTASVLRQQTHVMYACCRN